MRTGVGRGSSLALVLTAACALIVGTGFSAESEAPSAEEISYETEDGLTIYGDLYVSGDPGEVPLILLFHQASANARAEYEPIIPVLLEQGYSVMAIDQRNGGDRLGGTNRTVDELDGKKYGYCEAYPDLVGALVFADGRGFTGKRVVWGSSYSAALVIKLGEEYKDQISAVLAFSPASGDPLADCLPEKYSGDLEIPALMLRPGSEMTRERTQKQLELFKKQGHQIYVSENGVHGSSMLNQERVGGDVGDTWAVVLEFLRAVTAE